MNKIRKLIVEVGFSKGHLTSSLGCVEILYALYSGLNINKNNLDDIKNRDIVILSKEHARLAQVCTLAHLGFLDKNLLKGYMGTDGILGHDIYNIVADKRLMALDYGSGSLGHGESVAAGFAYANRNRKVCCLIGDGELQEGSVWEAFLFVTQHKLNNLITIIDKNNLQIDNRVENIIDTLSNLEDRLTSFGFEVFVCDGHNIDEIKKYLVLESEKPKCIIANTIKGKGMEYMLDETGYAIFHHSKFKDKNLKNRILEGIK